MSKIVYCITTKENITFTKDELGNVTDEFESDKFTFLCSYRRGKYLSKYEPYGSYWLGYYTRMYLEKVKREYPELYK